MYIYQNKQIQILQHNAFHNCVGYKWTIPEIQSAICFVFSWILLSKTARVSPSIPWGDKPSLDYSLPHGIPFSKWFWYQHSGTSDNCSGYNKTIRNIPRHHKYTTCARERCLPAPGGLYNYSSYRQIHGPNIPSAHQPIRPTGRTWAKSSTSKKLSAARCRASFGRKFFSSTPTSWKRSAGLDRVVALPHRFCEFGRVRMAVHEKPWFIEFLSQEETIPSSWFIGWILVVH